MSKSKAPKVYCPKERKEVYIWYCTGSFMQQRESCPHCVEAVVHYGKKAEVKCDWKEKFEELLKEKEAK